MIAVRVSPVSLDRSDLSFRHPPVLSGSSPACLLS